jgi:hypothetical protein
MLATGHRRNGAVMILAVILLVLSLVAVFMWVQGSRREPLPHAVPPARTEVQRSDFIRASAKSAPEIKLQESIAAWKIS